MAATGKHKQKRGKKIKYGEMARRAGGDENLA
jgi:hypothetical protein